MAVGGEETRKIIRIMTADLEAKKTIREYRSNDSLLGKVRVMEANRARFENAGFYAELLHNSMKAIRVASKKLKSALEAPGSKRGSGFTKRVDKIMTNFEKQQDLFDETLGELDLITDYLNDGSDGEDDHNNSTGGSAPPCIGTAPLMSSLCSLSSSRDSGDVSNSVPPRPRAESSDGGLYTSSTRVKECA